MMQVFKDVRIDWLANRRWFIGLSVLLMLAGLGSAIFRQVTHHQAFNLGVDFKGGTVVTVRFKQRPADEAIRAALAKQGVKDAIVQLTDKPDTVLIKLPLEGQGEAQAQVDAGRDEVRKALNTFGPETPPKLI